MDPARLLQACRTSGGGYAIAPGADPEPEPTAMAALALDDDGARRWLASVQEPDGGVVLRAGSVARDLTALAVLALREPDPRERAMDHLAAAQAATLPWDPRAPHDPDTRGWPWTNDTFGWVEPTSWALLAFRRFRPTSPLIEDGLAVLRDRECEGGGWNHGNAQAFKVRMPAFGQATAVALIALRGLTDPIIDRGLVALRALVDAEGIGPLTTATAAVALRLHGDTSWRTAASSARTAVATVEAPDAITLAWTILAGQEPSLKEALAS